MSGARVLHFSLAPVQTFVGQARRTRDLWAGSFLLSWLSGKAMRAIVDGNYGRIEFPEVTNDSLFCALAPDYRGNGPVIGSLPNRFKAVLTSPDDVGMQCRAAVQQAWCDLATAVRETFITPIAAQGNGTGEIWDRQIDHFWETVWVTGPNPQDNGDGAWLDRRKNWRSHERPDEPGDHCMLMGDWQEISGFVRFHERTAQDLFWNALRQTVLENVYPRLKGHQEANILELRDNERLCAIALVKRLFPLLPDEILRRVIGWVPDESRDTLRKWPSTAYMAAAPWMKRAWRTNEEACRNYVTAIGKRHEDAVLMQRAEHRSRIKNFRHMNQFADLDGRLFYADAIRADTITSTDAVLDALHAFQSAIPPETTHRKNKMHEAAPFHALLLMDGDRVGDWLSKLGGNTVSQALERFIKAVPEIVDQYEGVTIYAGGDDYLGFFPLTTALSAAAALTDAYRNAWNGQAATTSAGLVFAHYGVALSAVIRRTHELLEEVAKDQNGRDGIAVEVIKPSGPAVNWVSCWSEAGQDAATGITAHLVNLANAFADDDERSTSFVYNIRERYDPSIWQTLDLDQARAILLAERLKGTDAPHAQIDQELDELLGVCRPLTRRDGTISRVPLSMNGALLARFLADNGIWM
ncbi:MAG: hypothetical protein H7834_14360 [Magnetococcus sp. YQC-9]